MRSCTQIEFALIEARIENMVVHSQGYFVGLFDCVRLEPYHEVSLFLECRVFFLAGFEILEYNSPFISCLLSLRWKQHNSHIFIQDLCQEFVFDIYPTGIMRLNVLLV